MHICKAHGSRSGLFRRRDCCWKVLDADPARGHVYDAHIQTHARDSVEREGRIDEHAGGGSQHARALRGTDARERPDEGSRLSGSHLDEGEQIPRPRDEVNLEGADANILTQYDKTARDQVVARGFFCDPPEGMAPPARARAHFFGAPPSPPAAAFSPLQAVRLLDLSQSPVQSTAGLYFVSVLMQ